MWKTVINIQEKKKQTIQLIKSKTSVLYVLVRTVFGRTGRS